MSDYMRDPRRPDKYGHHDRFQDTYEPVNGRSNFAFVALLAAVALVGGLLFFATPPPSDQQAMEPPATQTAPTPAPATRE